MAVDAAGGLYVLAQFQGTSSFGTVIVNSAGEQDVAFAKYDVDGTFLWVRQIGGPSVEYGYDFAVTPSGQSFVTGHFSDRASFDGANAVASSYYDIFIASYRADGDLAWLRTPTGTAGGSSGHCMALDSDTNVFVSGFFSGRADFGATNLTATGSDIFLAKYDSTGRFQWAKRFDVSPGSGSGEVMAINSAREIYLAGRFAGTVAFGGSTLSTIYPESLFLAKFSRNGDVLWAQSIEPGGWSSSIGVDDSGNCYLAGSFQGSMSVQGLSLTGRGSYDGFLMKFNTAGGVLFTRVFGGPGADACNGLFVDRSGNCFISGAFQNTGVFGGFSMTAVGRDDIFLAKLDPAGTIQWVNQAGGPGEERGEGITVDSHGDIYISGESLADIFIAKRASHPQLTIIPPNSQTRLIGEAVTFTVTVNNIVSGYQWQKDGSDLPGKTNQTLTITSVQPSDAGSYRVRVSALEGSATSAAATLTVRAALRTSTAGGGTIIRVPDQSDYAPGAQVSLTATPAEGFTFFDWSGAVLGSVNPITLILNSNVTVEAHFGSPFLEVSVRGSGTVNRSPDKSQYIAGEHVTLTAVPGRWYIFERWADGSPINPRTITIGLSNTYAAVFSPTTALERVTFNGVSRTAPIGMPAVFLDSQFILTDVVNRFASTEVTLQTTFPNGAILFTLDGTPPSLGSALYTGPFTLRRSAILRTMAYNAAFTFSAEGDPVKIMVIPTYSLTAATDGGGQITLNPPGAQYPSNATVTMTAMPDSGWAFMRWRGDVSSTDAVLSISMRRRKCVEAVFGTALGATAAGSGTVEVHPFLSIIPYGTVIQLSAEPFASNYFALWGNGTRSTNNPVYITVTNANLVITAAFQPLDIGQVALTAIPIGDGVVTLSPRGNRFNFGQTVSLTAVAEPDQAFVRWSGDISGTQNPLRLTLLQSRSIRAEFTRRPKLQLWECVGRDPQSFHFRLSGGAGIRYVIEKSNNLRDWQAADVLTNDLGISDWLDYWSPFPTFYRAREGQ